MDFDTLWEKHNSRLNKINKIRRVQLFFILSVISLSIPLGSLAMAKLNQRDFVDYPFIKDDNIIGYWKVIAIADTPEKYLEKKEKTFSDIPFEGLAFSSATGVLVKTYGEELKISGFNYTKDHILHPSDKTDSIYLIKEVDGVKLLFFQWKSGDYIFSFKKPPYYVLKQVDSNDRNLIDTTAEVGENELPTKFINDPKLIGTWETVDFTANINYYTYNGKKQYSEELYLTKVEFLQNAIMSEYFKSELTPYNNLRKWSKGVIFNEEYKYAKPYFLKKDGNTDLLFLPWLNGDVLLRGEQPSYYVLKRIK